MDALDRIAGPGQDLLARVDTMLLRLGAPDSPRLRTLLSGLGALPGDAFDFVVGLRPEPFQEIAGELRARATAYGEEATALTGAVAETAWQGAGREAFLVQWQALAAHLGHGDVAAGGGPDSMTGRLGLLASYVDELADWMRDTRRSLAGSVATVLSSSEAVRLRAATGTSGAGDGVPLRDLAEAAAVIGLTVLSTVDDAVRSGQDLYAAWAPRLGPLAYRSAQDPGAFTPTIVSV